MTRVPIVFAFDNNLAMPAAVCFYSLLVNAKPTTAYDIYILHRGGEQLDLSQVERVMSQFPQSTLTLRDVGAEFDSSFEIRGITTPAYYRLLIPQLIPEHDKVLYSDVDVIFRDDLTEIYRTDISGYYFGGVNSMSHFDDELIKYYTRKLQIDPSGIIYSGNLLINCKELREATDVTNRILKESKGKYRFQDMDVINVVCKGHIKYLSPAFCLTNYINKAIVENDSRLRPLWSEKELQTAMDNGIIHYNGQKPWKGYCPNFDIWWEYYRKSPIFDEKFYFDFYYRRLNELDALPFVKRIKILARYFVYGRRTNP
jgi:Lipopolysaccharide biosynthesis proteins, LPS:glycosyltransferases